MRSWVVGASVLLSGCLGLGMRSDLDDEPIVTETRVTILSALPGARATLGSMEIVLDDGRGEGVVDPPLGIEAFTLVLERDGASVALDATVEGHYERGGIDRDALLDHTTLLIHRLPDGRCHITFGCTETDTGLGWESFGPAPEPCGPWATP